MPLLRLGTDYGGWWIPSEFLRRPGVAYCAGAGEDVSFDMALANAGLEVWTFDPTPRAIEYVSREAGHLNFLPIGWWDKACELRFYSPRNPDHVSHSATNPSQTDSYFVAPVQPVNEIMKQLGHVKVNIIKMDIEGAEFRVIDTLDVWSQLPDVICVEFDQPCSVWAIRKAVRKIRNLGYSLEKIEGWNYTFCNPASVGSEPRK